MKNSKLTNTANLIVVAGSNFDPTFLLENKESLLIILEPKSGLVTCKTIDPEDPNKIITSTLSKGEVKNVRFTLKLFKDVKVFLINEDKDILTLPLESVKVKSQLESFMSYRGFDCVVKNDDPNLEEIVLVADILPENPPLFDISVVPSKTLSSLDALKALYPMPRYSIKEDKGLIAIIDNDVSVVGNYPHYRKDVRGISMIDTYKINQLYDVNDPTGTIPHLMKKLLVSGARGAKPKDKDKLEAFVTFLRCLELDDLVVIEGEFSEGPITVELKNKNQVKVDKVSDSN